MMVQERKVLKAKYVVELAIPHLILCVVVKFAERTKFYVNSNVLLSNVHWHFPVFEYLLLLFVNNVTNKMQGEDMNVVDNFNMKSEVNLKPKLAKAILILTAKPTSG